MGELVATIAHEVNQPLTAIVTYAGYCLRQLATDAPDLRKLREAIGEIVNDGARANAVISQIRAQLMKGTPDRVMLDINEVIREVVSLMRNEVTRSHISLRTDLTPDLPSILGDRVQLQQVLINLIMNSIDAMGTVTDRPRELRIESGNNPDGVLIQVQDSGRGFDPGQADLIFEPFFTTRAQGIGMGLSISLSIIESHGGRLWAESGSKGALFQFTLPTQD
jgi:signal transduction histidine kinase